MYESEIYNNILTGRYIPQYVHERIKKLREIITERSLIRWSEHCTECAYPECYSSCSLYSPREDGKCSRFVNGFEKLPVGKKESEYFLRIGFKKWGKLSGVFSGKLYSVETSEIKEQSYREKSEFVKSFPQGFLRQKTQQGFALSRQIAEKTEALNKNALPDYLIIEYFYSGEKLPDFTLTIYPENKKKRDVIYNKRLVFTPGYNLIIIDYNEIKEMIGYISYLRVSLTPNNLTDDDFIFFGLIEFVKSSPEIIRLKKIFKCIIFDLDNTLWQGTLVESKETGISVPEDYINILRKLDDAGIILSIASKNNEEDVLLVLKQNDIQEYFLHPQINWEPKSLSVAAISKTLNLNPDSFIFVDDSEFERSEVKTNYPAITTIHPDYITLLPHLLVQPSDKNEQINRRKFYQEEQTRNLTSESFQGDYPEFLRSCQLEITIENLDKINYNRVFELTQRTNQLNYSGTIYDANRLATVQQDENLSKFVISAKDKFGDYGIIGFVLFDKKLNTIQDMMFSCRIMGKKTEYEVISYIRNNFNDIDRDFNISFVPTKKNSPAKMVLDDLNILQTKLPEGRINYFIKAGTILPSLNIAKIISHTGN